MSERLVVVSAPSGTGKTSLDMKLVRTHADKVQMVRSCTTRAARHGDDKDYRFLSIMQFQQMINEQEFVEWAEVFGNYYGTSKADIEHVLQQKKIALLEVDVQGGKQLKNRYPHAVSVFILPPGITELCRRLIARDTDNVAAQQRRISAAHREIELGKCYDNFIINDEFDRTYKELKAIVLQSAAAQLTRADGLKICDTLLAEFSQLARTGTAQLKAK
ncbi:MAG: guanylate kinase [Pseudomonadota bacterium]|nr:guanylate kinase [Pseudomonadota bacterium]